MNFQIWPVTSLRIIWKWYISFNTISYYSVLKTHLLKHTAFSNHISIILSISVLVSYYTDSCKDWVSIPIANSATSFSICSLFTDKVPRTGVSTDARNICHSFLQQSWNKYYKIHFTKEMEEEKDKRIFPKFQSANLRIQESKSPAYV